MKVLYGYEIKVLFFQKLRIENNFMNLFRGFINFFNEQ